MWSSDGANGCTSRVTEPGIPNIYALESGVRATLPGHERHDGSASSPTVHPIRATASRTCSTARDGWDHPHARPGSRAVHRCGPRCHSPVRYGTRAVGPAHARGRDRWRRSTWPRPGPGTDTPAPMPSSILATVHLMPVSAALGADSATRPRRARATSRTPRSKGSSARSRTTPFKIAPRRYNPSAVACFHASCCPYIAQQRRSPHAPPGTFVCLDDVTCSAPASSAESVVLIRHRRASGATAGQRERQLPDRRELHRCANGSFTINRWLPGVSRSRACHESRAPACAASQFCRPRGAARRRRRGSADRGPTLPLFYWEKPEHGQPPPCHVALPTAEHGMFARYSFSDRRPRDDPELASGCRTCFDQRFHSSAPSGRCPLAGVTAWSHSPRRSRSPPKTARSSRSSGRCCPPGLGHVRSATSTRASAHRSPKLQLTSEVRRFVVAPWAAEPRVRRPGRPAGATFGTNEFFGNYVLGGPLGDGGFSGGAGLAFAWCAATR